MSEQPASIAREAKSLYNILKELLKAKEPFDRDVDFQRKNLRKYYLNLLLVHPYAKESKDIENHLWMQTSYSFIASYKTRIATLDRAIMQNARQNQQQQEQRQLTGQQLAQGQPQNQQPQPQPPQRVNPHYSLVEYRKLIQRFRQFLAEEEKFWTLLVQRMYRTFGLTEARSVLAELGILVESEEAVAANVQSNLEGGETAQPDARILNGRNHFQFPPENLDPTSLLPTPSNRGSRLAIFSKALVCLGDIARYRELYNDSNGRPRAGHDTVIPARRRNRRGQEIIPRARNYDKAQKCYDQARLLVPHEGNPWHQLAILSSYQKDTFLSAVHYYRALCVQQPYDTATDNLNTMLSKVLDTWKARNRQEREKMLDNGTASNVLVETFRERIIVLHALWRLGGERGIDKMDSIGRKLDQLVHHDFNLLVSERLLLADTISQIIVLSEGAFYKHRMIRPKTDRQPPTNTPFLLDWRIIRHIFDLHSTLLNVGKAELAVPPPSDVDVGENSLALKITAIFRRTLPGLRIASKWLRANVSTLMRDPEYIAFQEEQIAKGNEVPKKQTNKISGYSAITIEFWTDYTEFIAALAEAFPKSSLPTFTSPLDEDVDMRGFLPLKKFMGEDMEDNTGLPQSREKPHPNAEQLMRIYDLLEDASALAELLNPLVKLEGGRFVFNHDMVEGASASVHRHNRTDSRILGGTSPTEDDVVEEALRARDNGLLDQEFDEDEEEQIVYLQPTVSPVIKPATSPTRLPMPHIVPVSPVTSPKAFSPKSPTQLLRQMNPPPALSPPHVQPLPHTLPPPLIPHTTTAEDLLKDVMLGAKSDSASNQPRFLQSIWSASSDEQFRFAAGNSPSKNTYQSPRQYHSDLPQTWASSLSSGGSYLAQPNTTGTPQNSQTYTRSPQLSPLISGPINKYQHQRLPSLSSPNYHPRPTFNESDLQDTFAYSRLPQSQQMSVTRLPQTDLHPPPSTSSARTFNNLLFSNVTADLPTTFGSSLATGANSTSPLYVTSGLPLSPIGHARQISTGQSHHPPQHPLPSRPPVPGQPFAPMPQTW